MIISTSKLAVKKKKFSNLIASSLLMVINNIETRSFFFFFYYLFYHHPMKFFLTSEFFFKYFRFYLRFSNYQIIFIINLSKAFENKRTNKWYNSNFINFISSFILSPIVLKNSGIPGKTPLLSPPPPPLNTALMVYVIYLQFNIYVRK